MKRLQSLSYKTLFAILFFSLAGIVFFLKIGGKTQKVSAAWWDEMWHYRKAISITNTSGSNLTDFQVSISIGTSALIASGKMQTDCDDIRITDINGNLLSYWIEPTGPNSCNQTADTKVWVKANSLPTSGATVYVYYGNSQAASVSSGTDTFIYFKNNFQTSDLGWNWSNGGVESGWAKTWATGADNPGSTMTWLKNIINITGQEVVVEFTVKATKSGSTGHDTTNVLFNPTQTTALYNNTNSSTIANGSGNSIITFGNYSGWYGKVGFDATTGQASNITNDTTYPTYQFNTDGWVRHVHKLTNSSLLLSGYSLGGLSVGTSDWTYNEKTITSGYTKPNNIILAIGEQYYESIWLREAFIRKYTSTEPTVSLQSEESGGGPIAYWKFDEGVGTTAYDSAGNFNGSFSGTTFPTWQSEDQCISGKCLYSTGNGSVLIGNPSNFRIINNSITIETWVKFNSLDYTNNTGKLIGFAGKGSPDTAPGIASSGFWFSYDNRNNGKSFNYTCFGNSAGGYAGGNNNFSGYNYTFNNNTWYHLAITISQNQGRLYINGQQIGSAKTFSGLQLDNTLNNLYISSLNGSYNLPGYIDEPKIYPYARTADQIKQDYNSRGSASSKGSGVNMGTNKDNNSLSDGLVGYWKMDEGVGTTTSDSSGNNNTGTFTGATLPAWSSGKYGTGTSFNGVNSYVDIGNSSTIRNFTNQISVSVWAKYSAYGGGGQPYSVLAVKGTPWTFLMENPSNVIRFRVTVGGQDLNASDSQTHNLNQWYHFVGTYDGQNIKMYKDGILVGTTPATGNLGANDVSAKIGTFTGNTYNFNGLIDEVRIYNRALSPAEVSSLYNYAPGPIGYWDFNDGGGNSVVDKSGNNNPGTWSGTGSRWTQGKIGGGGNFNGNDDYVNLGTFSSLDFSKNFTASAWIKSSNKISSKVFLGKYNGSGSDYWFGFSVGQLHAQSGCDASNQQSSDGNWHYITNTCLDGISYLYNNSILIDTGTCIASNPNGNLKIGSFGDSGGFYWNGLIDEVKIYNYARTNKQIIEDMNAGAPATSAKSLVAYYKFDEGSGSTTHNSSNLGSSLNGSFQGTPSRSTNGKFNKAVNFDTSDDYITVTNQTSLNPSSITISMWILLNSDPNCDGNNNWRSIINKGIFAGGTNGYDILLEESRLIGWDTGNGTSDRWWPSTAIMPINKWTHLTVIYDEKGEKLMYLDGKNVGKKTITAAPLSPNSGNLNFTISSASCPNGNGNFPGLIDEVKIYNYALTPEEVKQDYNAGSAIQFGQTTQNIGGTTTSLEYCIPGDTSFCAPPIAEWKMDEGVGTSTVDTIGNNNTGTWQGTLGNQWSQGKIGKAGKFNGTNNYVLGSKNLGISGDAELTMCAWIKWTGTSWPNDWASFMGNNSTGSINNGLSFTINQGRPAIDFWNNRWRATNALNINQWYYICGTKTPGIISTNSKIFINGQIVTGAVEGVDTTPNIIDSPPVFGRLDSTRWFNGLVDHVKIYNYARTPAQIAYDYNKGGPVGWWKFDECQGNIAYDWSGIGNTGVINIGTSGTQNSLGTCAVGTSAAWTNGASGKNNSSLNFDGVDDYISIPNNNSLNLTESGGSISLWFKTNTSATGSINGSLVAKTNSYGNGYWFTKYNNKLRISLYGTSSLEMVGNKIITDNIWHHAIANWTPNTLSIYIDGILDKSQSYSFTMSTANQPFYVARMSSSGEGYFQGKIDDVRIYNYALTEEQIKQIYNGGAVNFQ